MSETLENKKKRLIFRSWHRGTREMDLILGRFAEAHVMDFDETQLALYEDILQENDPDLYNWISGRETLPTDKSNPVLELLVSQAS